jgi:hypothetical protein
MRKRLRVAVEECGERFTVEDVAAVFEDLFGASFDDLLRIEGLRIGLRRSMSLDDRLDVGGAPIPSVIATRQDGEATRHVHLFEATWEELTAAHQQRVKNLERMRNSEYAFRRFVDVLRPLMEGTDLTVLDALGQIESCTEVES